MRLIAVVLVGVGLITVSALNAETNAERNARIEKILPELQRLTIRYRVATHTPGVAVAVVTPDQVYFINTGRRRVSSTARVCECTAFQLASVSKAITGTYVARLVTEGKLKWNDRIVDLLPGFSFASKAVTDQVTVLDMMTQRSGLLNGTGNIVEDIGHGQKTVFESMRLIDPAPGFRKTWAYVNYGITIGGVAAAQSTRWEFPTSIKKELFEPLGMDSTTARHARFATQRNRAQMNFYMDGKSAPIFGRNAQAQAPAAGVSGNAADLAALLQMYLNDGKVDGKTFLSPQALKTTISPLTYIATAGGFDSYYGIGWFVSVPENKNDFTIVSHGGTFVGSRTLLSFQPERKIGIVVLCNGAEIPPECVERAFYQLYDHGHARRDTLQNARIPSFAQTLRDIADILRSPTKLPAVLQGRPISAYPGVYANAYLGRVTITRTAEGLTFTGGPDVHPMPLRLWNGKLYIINGSGDSFPLQFEGYDGGRFTKLDFPALEYLGWNALPRIR